jgi:hypothetical protein
LLDGMSLRLFSGKAWLKSVGSGAAGGASDFRSGRGVGVTETVAA